jgi:hypothetical protein
MDLRGGRLDGPISQCLCADRAALHESAGPESIGSDAVRATIPGRTASGSFDIRRTYDSGGEAVPPPTGASLARAVDS